MSDKKTSYISFAELCVQPDVGQETVFKIVEQGIVEPIGNRPDEWLFTPKMLLLMKKAVRLHRDLQLGWDGIALALELLDELEQLREKNRQLERRLNRFMDF